MSTVLAEPFVREVAIQDSQAVAPALTLVSPKPAPAEAETNPFIYVLVAIVISLAVSTTLIGSVAAWIYFLSHSGAFAR